MKTSTLDLILMLVVLLSIVTLTIIKISMPTHLERDKCYDNMNNEIIGVSCLVEKQDEPISNHILELMITICTCMIIFLGFKYVIAFVGGD